MTEVWKDIKGYEGLYQVSNIGRVKSLLNDREIILKGGNSSGYRTVGLNGKTYFVHRLVGENFIPNPDNLPQINHRNELKSDNNVSNLEWCTACYNANYGSRNQKLSKPVYQIDLESGQVLFYWSSASDVQRKLGYSASCISRCCKSNATWYGFRWEYANPDDE